jgi:hypothetical protein
MGGVDLLWEGENMRDLERVKVKKVKRFEAMRDLEGRV